MPIPGDFFECELMDFWISCANSFLSIGNGTHVGEDPYIIFFSDQLPVVGLMLSAMGETEYPVVNYMIQENQGNHIK